MAKAIYVQKGEIMDFINNGTETIGYDDVVELSNRIGIAKEQIEPGKVGSVSVAGVYELPADTAAAFVTGDSLYWKSADGKIVKTATGNIPAGWAFADKAAAGASVLVKIG
ncbi:MAG: capsid cement protein [Sporomusa sp.]